MNLRNNFNSFYLSGLLALAIFIVIRFGLEFNGLYGQDSHEYLRYGEALQAAFQSGQDPGDYFWPVNFPLYGAIISLVFHDVNFSMQLISLLAFVGVFIYTIKVLQLIFLNEGNRFLYAYCFLFLSPLVLRAAFLIMSDMLCLFFIMGAFFHFFKYRKEESLADFAVLTFYSLSAVMTRYPSFVVLILPGILTIRQLLIKKELLRTLLAICIAALVLLPHAIIKAKNSTSFIFHEFFMDWSPVNFFRSEFVTQGGGAENYQLPNAVYSFFQVLHPGYLFIGPLLLLLLKKDHFRSIEVKVIAFSVLIYALFLSGIPYQNIRYVLLTFPLGLICLYPAYMIFNTFITKKKLFVPVTIAILSIQIALFCYVFNIFYQRNKFEKEVFSALEGYPKNTLYTFDLDVALRSYHTKHQLVNLITSEIVFKNKALVLFNDQLFNAQWVNTPLALNWSSLNSSHELHQLKTFENGWKLYEIK
jgi:hypothetical protein